VASVVGLWTVVGSLFQCFISMFTSGNVSTCWFVDSFVSYQHCSQPLCAAMFTHTIHTVLHIQYYTHYTYSITKTLHRHYTYSKVLQTLHIQHYIDTTHTVLHRHYIDTTHRVLHIYLQSYTQNQYSVYLWLRGISAIFIQHRCTSLLFCSIA